MFSSHPNRQAPVPTLILTDQEASSNILIKQIDGGIPPPGDVVRRNRRTSFWRRRRNLADLISFGRLYIANPDLVERMRTGTRLNNPDRVTFVGGGAAGYTDYPVLTRAERGAA